MGIMQEIESLQKKAGSYAMLKEEYDRLVAEVKRATEALNAITGSAGGSRSMGSGKRGAQKMVADKLYMKLKTEDSFFVTNDTVRAQLELEDIEATASAVGNVLARVKSMPGVKKTKDGNKIRLFYAGMSIESDNVKFGSVKA